ncbi:hypothetical protein EX30DRAFT_363075 [Ascodesmis nigricans]|uniref:Integral membrane protein n=1 Tax=Ascodesmis nigricans TaxID=341454 RepID=A0A4S2N0J7_9PEZI|nr:hypothetical protein EX30DRAFT_363075 [Ascodesmis nigricans]
MPTPTPDFCWEGRLALILTLLTSLCFFATLRFKALRGSNYPAFSPRGIAGGCVGAIVMMCTVYMAAFVWNYSVWYKVRGMHERAWKNGDDGMVETVWGMMPQEGNRKAVCMRLKLYGEEELKLIEGVIGVVCAENDLGYRVVAGQWIANNRMLLIIGVVRFSFVLIFYEFRATLQMRTRLWLYLTTGSLGISYVLLWVVTAVDLTGIMELERYSPTAGAGVTLFTPLATWSNFRPQIGNDISTLLVTEVTITTFNVATDILLLITVTIIFKQLSHSSPGRNKQFRAASLMMILFFTSLTIAIIRFGVLLSRMKTLYTRLAFDTLTDVEAFIAGIAACMPAVRVLVRKKEVELVELVDMWRRGRKWKEVVVGEDQSSVGSMGSNDVESCGEGRRKWWDRSGRGKRMESEKVVQLGEVERLGWEDMAQRGIR